MSERPFYLNVEDRETYRAINQAGVHQYAEPRPSLHNACWDAVLAPDGKVLLSLCSELTTSEYAKLAEYDPETNTLRELHYTKEVIMAKERTIRDSKIHTAMSWMNDGRLVMLTHTTDKAPAHPSWLPKSYYNHPFEGYPGSSLLTYDPKTGKMENWGIPVARETIYGAAYDKINNILYGIGFIRGHLYGIDLNDRSVTDHGQVTEWGSYRLVVGPDDNIYFTTRNGLLQRINVREKKVENLKIQLPHKKEAGRLRPYLTYGVTGPDGKLYMAGMHDRSLCCYDTATGEFSVVGDYLRAEEYIKGEPSNNFMGCMGFDKEGVLYYVVCNLKKRGGEGFLVLASLMRWDFFRGKEPEYLGLLGTPERGTYQCCSMMMNHQKDELYCVGTNHADDGVNAITIRLSEFREKAHIPGPKMTDPLQFEGNGIYEEYAGDIHDIYRIMRENSIAYSGRKCTPVRLWDRFEDQENSHVLSLEWQGKNLVALCGKTRFTKFTISPEGEILKEEPATAPAPKEKPQVKGTLPAYPGRNYKRGAALAAHLSGGRRLIATEDGMLAIEKGEKIFSLGPGWVNGPVWDLAANREGTEVYGVAGDPEDINMIFRYDDEAGLQWLGAVVVGDWQKDFFGSYWLTSVALKDDGSLLAVGAGGRMGTVYLFGEE